MQTYFTPYLRPQEAGNRSKIRWYQLFDENGGLEFTANGGDLKLSALPYSAAQVEAADHTFELTNNYTWVRALSAQMGVGGEVSLISFNDTTAAEFAILALTSVHVETL